MWGEPDLLAQKGAVLDRHCEAEGRDPATIRRSAQALLFLSEDPAVLARIRAMKIERPTIVGNAAEVRDIVGRYRDAGVDELIVPGHTFRSTGERRGHARPLPQRRRRPLPLSLCRGCAPCPTATAGRASGGAGRLGVLPLEPSSGSRASDAEFMHQRCPVGAGPSGKTWPRWAPQRAHARLDADHAVAGVGLDDDRIVRHRRPEARPAGARVELRVRAEQLRPADDTVGSDRASSCSRAPR